MAELAAPKAELVLTVESNYGPEREEVARLTVDSGVTINGSEPGKVTLGFDPNALITSTIDALENLLRELREELATPPPTAARPGDAEAGA